MAFGNMCSMRASNEFSRIRGIFFPIHFYELKKFLPLGIILFIILFNHYCLKNIKDSLIVTNIGAEAISFIKLFCVPPGAILCMLAYAKLSDILKNEHLFYVTLGTFITFFTLFAFFIYPCRAYLHPSQSTVLQLQESYPLFHWAFAILGVWSYALFYVFAELWSSFIVTLSFWQFVNQITHVAEAKRSYGFLALLGQGAVFLSGLIGSIASNIDVNIEGVDPWQTSLNYLIGIVVLSSLVAMFLYGWIYKNVLTDKRFYDKPHLPGIDVNKKKKGNLWHSLKLAITSPYLGLIAMLVICYGITDSILENFWKFSLSKCFTNINQYNTFMCQYTMIYGLVSIGIVIVAGNILRLFRWSIAAIITPLIVAAGGIFIFLSFIMKDKFLELSHSIETYQWVVVVGSTIVVVLIKSAKMALFDLSKEMAYIPLDEELKVKGKAVVDVLGYRFGKSGGSGLQVILLTAISVTTGITTSYATIAPYSFAVFLTFCLLWIVSVRLLSRRVKEANRLAGEIPNED